MTAATVVRARGYVEVFEALIVLTLATVAAASLDLPTLPTLTIGLAVATAKALLVALCFMHVIHDRGVVCVTLARTAVLC